MVEDRVVGARVVWAGSEEAGVGVVGIKRASV